MNVTSIAPLQANQPINLSIRTTIGANVTIDLYNAKREKVKSFTSEFFNQSTNFDFVAPAGTLVMHTKVLGLNQTFLAPFNTHLALEVKNENQVYSHLSELHTFAKGTLREQPNA